MKELLISLVVIIFAIPSFALADGMADYNANCIACHRGNAKTITKRANMLKIDPTKLNLTASKMNKDEMIAIIEKGKDKMPSFEKKLTKDQIIAIVDYVKGLSKK